jgi:hypothetical protein
MNLRQILLFCTLTEGTHSLCFSCLSYPTLPFSLAMTLLDELPYVVYQHSSLNHPFVLFSDSLDQFATLANTHTSSNMSRNYTEQEIEALMGVLSEMYSGRIEHSRSVPHTAASGTCMERTGECFSPSRVSCLVADFEGEMLGFGGEVTVATFLPHERLPTTHGDVALLREEIADKCPGTRLPGLCIDMTCARGILLCRTIMESPDVAKLIWGAESDLCALVHQQFPRRTNIVPSRLVDVQLRFSETPQKRLGLGRAIAHITKQCDIHRTPHTTKNMTNLLQLPNKQGSVDWDVMYAQNKRAMPFPLSTTHLQYALDDVHRIDIVLIMTGGWEDMGGKTTCAMFPSLDPKHVPVMFAGSGDVRDSAGRVGTGTNTNTNTTSSPTTDTTISVVCGYDQRPRVLPYTAALHQARALLVAGIDETPQMLPVWHDWASAEQLSRNELEAIQTDRFGLRWFYRQRKTYGISLRNNHPRVQQLRRAVVLQRHLSNVSRMCGGWSKSQLAVHHSPSDVRLLVQMRSELDKVLQKAGIQL